MRVTICDDDLARGATWASRIEALAPQETAVGLLTGSELLSTMDALIDRSRVAERRAEPSRFDTVDVLIVDSDLTPDLQTLDALSAKGEDAGVISEGLSGKVGDSIAYHCRVWTDVGQIVVVNQGFSEATFDLTMRKFNSGIADLYISEPDLLSERLWHPLEADGTYQPWAWPALNDDWTRIRQLYESIALDDEPLLSRLEINAGQLYADQLDVFGDADPESASLEDLARSSMGFRPNDRSTDDTRAAHRMGVSVLSRWVERLVAPAGNVWIDLPHLLMQFPSLQPEGDATAVTTYAHSPLSGDDPIAQCMVSDTVALLYPRQLFNVERVRELVSTYSRNERSDVLVFAEDTSRFVSIEDATEVLSGLPGGGPRRYVEEVESVRYIPRVRLL